MLALTQSEQFYELLQGDKIQEALELRLDELEGKAKTFHVGMASSKGTSVVLAVAGLASMASLGTISGILAGIGLVGYVHSVLADYGETKELCFFPWNRKPLSSLTNSNQNRDENGNLPEEDEDNPLEEVLSSLTPTEKIEYLSVRTCFSAIANYLKSCPAAIRSTAYRHALRQMELRQDFAYLPPQEEVLSIAGQTVSAVVEEVKSSLPVVTPVVSSDVPKLFADLDDLEDDEITEDLIEDSWDDEPEEQSEAIAPAARVFTPKPYVPLPAKDEALSPLIEDLLDEGCVWLIGRKGSGKTSKVEWFVEQYLDLGYEVWVVDPHAKAGQWGDLKVFGRGMDYRSVERALAEYTNTIDHRYKRRSREVEYDPMVNEKRLIIVCEEMTKWGAQVNTEIMTAFMGCVLADLRKANAGCLFVSHGETLNMFGGQKALAGFRDAIDTDIAKLYAYSEPVPGSRPTQYQPKPMGKVLYPGESTAREVRIGDKMQANGRHFTPVRDLGKVQEQFDNVIQLRRQA